MKSLSIFLTSLLLFLGGAGVGIVGLLTWEARQPSRAVSAEAKPLQTQITSLQSELEACRTKIGALEASAAAAKLAAGTQRFTEARPDAPAARVEKGEAK